MTVALDYRGENEERMAVKTDYLGGGNEMF